METPKSRKILLPLTDTERAYIAAFIDGEGSIQIRREKKDNGADGHWYAALVSVGNTHEGVLDWLAAKTGVGKTVPYTEKGNRKPAWRWTVHSQQARQLLEAIRPFMIVKGEQADNAISLTYAQHVAQNGKPVPDEEWARREAIYLKNKELNKRGL